MKKTNPLLVAAIAVLSFYPSFAARVQGQTQDAPLPVILDADVGSSTDDLFALMALHQYADEGRVDLLGVVCDREGEKNAETIDVLNVYYGRPNVPIGLERDGVKNPRVFIPYSGIVDLTDDAGAPLFKRSVDAATLPDGYKLYRKLLANAQDHSVAVVAIGFVTTLSELFDSQGDEYSPLDGLTLFAQKVKAVYVQAGRFQAGDSLCGYNMRAAVRQSENFYGKFPKNVLLYMSPSYVGDNMDYPPDDVIADLSSVERNPIKAVYTNYDCDTGQRMWDVNCVLNAVEGDERFHLSPRGWVTFVNRGEKSQMFFEEDPEGNARFQLLGDSYDCQTKVMEIRRMTRLAPNPGFLTIESPQPQFVGKAAVEWAKPRLTLLADRYMGSAGNVLDPDRVRDLFYPLGYTGPNWQDYEEAKDLVVEEIFKRMAKKALRAGRRSLVIVTGVPGCGKTYTTRALNLGDAGLVYDASLLEDGDLERVVEAGRAAGLEKITVVPVYNDVLACYQNTIARGHETQRYTALDYMVGAFRGYAGRLAKLREEYPDLTILPVDGSGNAGIARVSLDAALNWNFEIDDETMHRLFVYFNGLLDAREIDPELVEAAAGDLSAIPGLNGENEQLALDIDEKVLKIAEASRMKF